MESYITCYDITFVQEGYQIPLNEMVIAKPDQKKYTMSWHFKETIHKSSTKLGGNIWFIVQSVTGGV